MRGNGRSSTRSPTSAASARTRRRPAAPGDPRHAPATRAERRKHDTRERLLDGALRVFLARGYDAATTTEMARAADLGAGTFYLYFRDKRAAFEGIAQRVARSVMERWLGALAPGMSASAGAALVLELAAAFWREHPDQARLLLEGGPSFGTAAHVRLVDDVAAALRTRLGGSRAARLAAADARALGALVVGSAIEIGRLVLAPDADASRAAVGRMIELVRHAAETVESPTLSGSRGTAAPSRGAGSPRSARRGRG